MLQKWNGWRGGEGQSVFAGDLIGDDSVEVQTSAGHMWWVVHQSSPCQPSLVMALICHGHSPNTNILPLNNFLGSILPTAVLCKHIGTATQLSIFSVNREENVSLQDISLIVIVWGQSSPVFCNVSPGKSLTMGYDISGPHLSWVTSLHVPPDRWSHHLLYSVLLNIIFFWVLELFYLLTSAACDWSWLYARLVAGGVSLDVWCVVIRVLITSQGSTPNTRAVLLILIITQLNHDLQSISRPEK